MSGQAYTQGTFGHGKRHRPGNAILPDGPSRPRVPPGALLMRIAIVCPNASSNSLVRTYPIAKVLARRHEVQVYGFRFGDGVFAPYRDEFEYRTVAGRGLPAFLGQVQAMARTIDADAVYAFKPLPSSFWVALQVRNRRVSGADSFTATMLGMSASCSSAPRPTLTR